MSKKVKIGFDLGNHSLKIAALKAGGLEFHELPLPEHLMEEDAIPMPHAFSAFLKKTKRELRLPGGPAALLLPSSQVICRQVTMPRMSVDQLMLNLPYEFSDFIQGEAHQYHCDYALCREEPGQEPGEEETDPQMTMMAAVVEKQQVRDYIRMFAAGGFSLKRILPQEMALIQLAEACPVPEVRREACFVDLGYLSTRAFILHGDRVQATRRIPTGCRELDRVIADILNVEPFLAGSYKRSNYQGILEDPRCVEVYEHIAVELLKLVNFYHFTYRQSQLQGIYLIGGGAQIAPLRRVLEETLALSALPVEALLPSSEKAPLSSPFVNAAGLISAVEEE